MKWIIYYVITLGLNLVCLCSFHDQVNVDINSTASVFLIGLSIYMATFFHSNPSQDNFYASSVGPDLNSEEWKTMCGYMMASHCLVIPLMLPFVWFFGTWVKLLSVILFFVAFAGGILFFRLRHRKEYRARFDKEKKELEEQKRREELGYWKTDKR